MKRKVDRSTQSMQNQKFKVTIILKVFLKSRTTPKQNTLASTNSTKARKLGRHSETWPRDMRWTPQITKSLISQSPTVPSMPSPLSKTQTILKQTTLRFLGSVWTRLPRNGREISTASTSKWSWSSRAMTEKLSLSATRTMAYSTFSLSTPTANSSTTSTYQRCSTWTKNPSQSRASGSQESFAHLFRDLMASSAAQQISWFAYTIDSSANNTT